MITVQTVLGFILGFTAAILLLALLVPIAWRRALLLMRHAVQQDMPQSLQEAKAEQSLLRAKQAAEVTRLQAALAEQQRQEYSGKIALSKAREHLAAADDLAARCKAQQQELAKQHNYILHLEKQNEKTQQKAAADMRLKQADLQRFRQAIKLIAAQTAGAVAAREGAESPVWGLVSGSNANQAAQSRETGIADSAPAARLRAARETLADAIYHQAKKAQRSLTGSPRRGSANFTDNLTKPAHFTADLRKAAYSTANSAAKSRTPEIEPHAENSKEVLPRSRSLLPVKPDKAD